MQLLCALRFFATVAFYNCIGETLGVTKASVGRAIDNVSDAICRLGQDWIVFPVGQTLATVQRAFHDIAGFPNVAGCIDGVFVRIQAPKEDEQDFVNRKGFLSLNCQMTCDASYKITSCVCKWPGSCHDSRMLRDSNINNKFETGQYNGILLGDSAYPTRRFLMTPYNNPTTPQQQRFNNALCKTRVRIEQTYGILKRRFACLHSGLRVDPNKAARIITACAVLHNIGIYQNDIINIDDDHIINVGDHPISFNGVNDGNATRDHICTSFF
ncbi:putative nuclease HARBI1 [Mizuhopecten yessoensis]|uniref:putative nuclease HARBI1 n=1 Tax=Mizuhopecten yessoensis TaxID=6573 RepID=UPI000B45F198|nr:putative nuclease HARBI1 [Mizuhopecten yessoensis]